MFHPAPSLFLLIMMVQPCSPPRPPPHCSLRPLPSRCQFFWDPLAVAVMVQPDVVEYEDIQIEIVASMPPDVTIDGWTKRSDTAGRVMKARKSLRQWHPP